MLAKIRKLDMVVVDRVTGLHRPILNRVMVFFTHAGSAALFWWVTAIIPCVIMRKYRIAINLALGIGITYVISEIIIKKLIGRIRPSESIHEDDMIISKPKDYSFPSGHTSTSFAAFAIIMMYFPVFIWIPAFFFASLIGFSRIYLRVHFLSDVVAGALLGMLLGVVSTVVFKAVVPM